MNKERAMVQEIAIKHIFNLLAVELLRGLSNERYFRMYGKTVTAIKRIDFLPPVSGYSHAKRNNTCEMGGLPENENPDHYNITV